MSYAKISGIYQITSKITGKYYVGSAISIKQRWSSHRSMLSKGKHNNKHLQNTFNKYGPDDFRFKVIEYCGNTVLIEREQYWIDEMDASNPICGLNNSPTASTSKGFRHSEATKKTLSEIAKSRDHTRLLEYSKSCIGKPGHSKGIRGRKHTQKEKEAQSLRQKGKVTWNKGIPQSEEVKQKISRTLIVKKINVKFTDKQRTEVLRLRVKGLGYYAISDLTGISMSQCHKIHKASLGIFYKKQAPSPAGKE